jgi:hypothetical protein
VIGPRSAVVIGPRSAVVIGPRSAAAAPMRRARDRVFPVGQVEIDLHSVKIAQEAQAGRPPCRVI